STCSPPCGRSTRSSRRHWRSSARSRRRRRCPRWSAGPTPSSGRSTTWPRGRRRSPPCPAASPGSTWSRSSTSRRCARPSSPGSARSSTTSGRPGSPGPRRADSGRWRPPPHPPAEIYIHKMNIHDESKGLDRRVSDLERDQALTILAEAAADGRLTLEEHAERVAAAYSARTRGELDALLADLDGAPARALDIPAATDLRVVLGNDSRTGRWVVPRHLRASAVLGDCHLELPDALLSSERTV